MGFPFTAYIRQDVSSRLTYLLRLPKDVRSAYENETCAERVSSIRTFLLVGISLYVSLFVSQYFTMPDVFVEAFAVKIGLVTPLCIAFYVALPRLSSVQREFLLFFGVAGSFLISAGLFWASHSALSGYNFAEFILFFGFANMLLVLRFRYALLFTVLAAAAGLLAVASKPGLVFELQIAFVVQLLAAAIFSLLANWRSESARCLSFLYVYESRKIASDAQEMSSRLRGLSLTDPLTAIPNRRAFDGFMEEKLSEGVKIGLMIVDVDHFKCYNDFYGHLAGDDCLRDIASILKKEADEANSFAARIGGEEFVVVTADQPTSTVLRLADRIVEGVTRLDRVHEGRRDHHEIVTISVGVAVSSPVIGETREDILRAADEALYEAKHRGRNRWEQAREETIRVIGVQSLAS